MRFIHCADLHLDSPLRGLELYEGAPVEAMRQATRRAFENVVALAIAREVDAVLIAGDIFDGDWQDFNTGLYFAAQLRRLSEADIPVFMLHGNHDAESKLTRSVPLPKNVFCFPARAPATQVVESLGVAIHGQSFATAAVTEDLAAAYPPPLSGLLNIGLLHTALTGREGHDPYAPTTVERLAGKGYDYWALGHAHTREVVREAPWVVFSGNTQGRHARETGAKGCMLVDAEAGEGVRSVEFVATDVARWCRLELDVGPMDRLGMLSAAIAEAVSAAQAAAPDRILALRLTLRGRSPLHRELVADREALRARIAAEIGEVSAGSAWLEKLRIKVTAPLDLARLARRDDPVGLLIRSLDALSGDADECAALARDVLAELEQKLPAELGSELVSPDALAEALASARERLLAAIAEEDTE